MKHKKLSRKQKEIISFMNKNMKELEKHAKELKRCLKKSREFFEEIGIKRES